MRLNKSQIWKENIRPIKTVCLSYWTVMSFFLLLVVTSTSGIHFSFCWRQDDYLVDPKVVLERSQVSTWTTIISSSALAQLLYLHRILIIRRSSRHSLIQTNRYFSVVQQITQRSWSSTSYWASASESSCSCSPSLCAYIRCTGAGARSRSPTTAVHRRRRAVASSRRRRRPARLSPCCRRSTKASRCCASRALAPTRQTPVHRDRRRRWRRRLHAPFTTPHRRHQLTRQVPVRHRRSSHLTGPRSRHTAMTSGLEALAGHTTIRTGTTRTARMASGPSINSAKPDKIFHFYGRQSFHFYGRRISYARW